MEVVGWEYGVGCLQLEKNSNIAVDQSCITSYFHINHVDLDVQFRPRIESNRIYTLYICIDFIVRF